MGQNKAGLWSRRFRRGARSAAQPAQDNRNQTEAKARQLRGRQSALAKRGLGGGQVVSYIERYLYARYSLFRWRREVGVVGKVALALGMAALTGLLAQLRVPLPFTPEPTTGQVFAVLLAGVLLGRWYGGLSQVLYAAIGGAGVGWFAGWSGGLGYLTGVSGGYMLGFIVAAFAIGWLTDRHMGARFSGEVDATSVAGRQTSSPTSPRYAAKPLAGADQAAEGIEDIKAKARQEAEAEAAHIVAEAQRKAQAILDQANKDAATRSVREEPVAETSPEVAPAAVEPAAEKGNTDQGLTEEERKALQEQLATVAGGLPEGASLKAPAAVEKDDTGQEFTEEERKALYSGEVELVLTPPIDVAVLSQMYSELVTNPEIRILRTVGSWERGTTITVFLDRALPLVSLLAQIRELRSSPGVKAGGQRGAPVERRVGRIGITTVSGVAAREAPPEAG